MNSHIKPRVRRSVWVLSPGWEVRIGNHIEHFETWSEAMRFADTVARKQSDYYYTIDGKHYYTLRTVR